MPRSFHPIEVVGITAKKKMAGACEYSLATAGEDTDLLYN